MKVTRIVAIPDGHAIVVRHEGDAPDCDLAPRKYERHVSRAGGTSGGLGRGGHTRDFWSKVRCAGLSPGGCWEWIGYLDKDGYGKLTTTRGLDGSRYEKPRTMRPHRALWEYLRGPIPAGLYLLHRCDNARCVNPDHLRPGTQAENIQECYAKGRHQTRADTRGELSGRAKLTTDAALFIRAQPKFYGLVPLLARLFGVSPVTVSKIRAGVAWRHLRRRTGTEVMTQQALRALIAQHEAAGPDLSHDAAARPGAA